MMKILPSSELYSHPNRLLEEHLTGTAKLAELFLSEKPPEVKKQLVDISKIIALSHDIGKSTKFFQDYLNAEDREKERLKTQKKTKHSLLSAVCAYYLSKQITDDKLLPFFAFVTVRRHHSNLIDLSDEVTLYGEEDTVELHHQVESIDDKKFSILADILFKAGFPTLLNKKIIGSWVDNLGEELKLLKKCIRKLDKEPINFITLNLLYSLLLDADKSDVVLKDISLFERKGSIPGNLVDSYKERNSFKDSPINYLREKAYQEIAHNIINLEEKIFSINLPTGLGKTLTSLSFALKLREKIGLNHRIIYALPFLSIIDQNSLVFESVLKSNGIEPYSNILLKHHHLSEIVYKKDNNEEDKNEIEYDGAKILIEGWNAEIIITTFIQLFHSLISNQNKSIRKFHRLSNSIIILDEIQFIPVKYWMVLKKLLLKISEMLNTYIIFVTATEPLIFGKGEIRGLGDRDFYFKALDRIVMKPLLDREMTIDELAQLFEIKDGRSYLFILNTITSARTFYNLIKEAGISTTYLSTHITPRERLERIERIRTGKYKVAVSTQLVEAGVDIDFDVVVRDLAPLDSINQSAGRCNRNGKQKGEVYIVSLKDDQGRLYSSYIYDVVLIDITKKILNRQKEIKESDLLSLIDEYYRETEAKKSQAISSELEDAITNLRYDSNKEGISISDFKLIDNDYYKIDVFIEIDDVAKTIWQRYLDLKYVKNLFERKKLFDLLKADFYQYVISIPANTENRPSLTEGFGYVKQDILEEYYDKETGFKIKDNRTIVIW
ncbi:CRISPR-associated helicase Cas3' [Calditerrivibrio sp.]|uniref:CRISPR-associated helicase Cas3' n=1 Tax=Calditerrivibrio sp. TaxID=2792612 RepID=UPI003D13CA43